MVDQLFLTSMVLGSLSISVAASSADLVHIPDQVLEYRYMI